MRSKTDRMICGTCEYWAGDRIPVFDPNDKPKIDIISENGLCMNCNSRFNDQVRKKDLNCKYFSKWTELF